MKTKKVQVARYVEPSEILESNINARFIKVIYKYDVNSPDICMSAILSRGDYVRNSDNGAIFFHPGSTLECTNKKIYISSYEFIY